MLHSNPPRKAAKTLGYYDVVRGWTPLTGEGSANTAIANSTIGDLAADQTGDGMFTGGWLFTVGSPTTGRNLPSPGTPLQLRFYNATTLQASTHFLEVSNPLWLWVTPGQEGGIIPEVIVDMLDSGTKMRAGIGGGTIDLTPQNLRIRTNIRSPVEAPEPTSITLLAAGILSFAGTRRRAARSRL